MTKFARLDRLPPYVFATVNQIKMDARRSGEDIIDLGMGNPDLGTPQHIVDKLIEASQKAHNHRYSASMGITKLRLAIAKHGLRGVFKASDTGSEGGCVARSGVW